MSVRIMSKIWDSGPDDRSELLVLLALSDFCNDMGECWPSMATIAEKSRMTMRGVRKIMIRLQEAGWLEIDERSGRGGCNKYRIKTLNPVPPEPRSPPEPGSQNPEPGSQNPERGSPKPLEPLEPSVSAREEDRDWFGEFFQAFPKKSGEARARDAFAEALSKADPELIVDAAKAYAEQRRDENPKFTKSPTNWLNEERWKDADLKPRRAFDAEAALASAASSIRSGKSFLCTHITAPRARVLIARGMVTPEQCQNVNVDF